MNRRPVQVDDISLNKMQNHFHCHKVEDQLWVSSSSSVDPSEGHAAGMPFLLKVLIFLMFCGPLDLPHKCLLAYVASAS